MRLNLLTACAIAAFSISVSGTYAATVTSTACTGTIAGSTTTIADAVAVTSACEFGTVSQDSVAQVNADELFSFTDWNFIAKDNDLDGTDEGLVSALTLTGTTLSGNWAVDAALFDTYANLMLVFKMGSETSGFTPAEYVGYLIGSKGPFAGTYLSMFQKNSNPGDISHVTLYGRLKDNNEPPPIPLPAGGLLLLTGLAGLGAASRRRKRK